MKTYIGTLKADCGKQPGSDRRHYVRIGAAFRDAATQQITIKLDSLPIPSLNWQGWANVFEAREGEKDTPF